MSKSRARIKDVLPFVDMPALRKFAAEQLAGGQSRAEVIEDVVQLVDASIPWEVIIPGPIGVIVEATDGPIAIVIAHMVVSVVEAIKRKGDHAKPRPA